MADRLPRFVELHDRLTNPPMRELCPPATPPSRPTSMPEQALTAQPAFSLRNRSGQDKRGDHERARRATIAAG